MSKTARSVRAALVSGSLLGLGAPLFAGDLSITIRGTLPDLAFALPAPFDGAVSGDRVLIHGSALDTPDLSTPGVADYPVDLSACRLTIGGVTAPMPPVSPIADLALFDDLSFGADRVAFVVASPWVGGLILARMDDTTQTWFNGVLEVDQLLDFVPGPIDHVNSFVNMITPAGPVIVRIDDFRFGDEAASTRVCVGDGSGAACPCTNTGSVEQGCANSTGAGATLSAFGSASAADDDAGFWAGQLPPATPAILFTGQVGLGGGSGLPFGAGLRCPGRGQQRLGVRTSGMDGRASWEPGLMTMAGALAGQTRYFQVWYADTQGNPCTGQSFNTTPAFTLTVAP